MLIIDGHLDLAWNALLLGRDITAPLAAIHAKEGPTPAHGEGTATVSLPALRTANIRLVHATIFVAPHGNSPTRQHGYRTPDEAYHQARVQVEYYQHLERLGEVTIVHNLADLEAVLDGRRPFPGLLLLMEGADPIRTSEDLAQFVAWGVRAIGLSWQATRYAGGAGAPGPLTDDGHRLLAEMEALGVTLDVSHLAEEAFWQALTLFNGPVIASHANCRALTPTDRQLSDAMLRAVAERGGVIGLVFYDRFICPQWKAGDGKAAVTLDDLLRHAEYLLELLGPQYVALGSDLDGGLGREVIPAEIDSISDLPRFAKTLAHAGAPPDVVAAIMGDNWLRTFRRMLGG